MNAAEEIIGKLRRGHTVVLTGMPGSGKTAMLRVLAETLRKDGRTAVVLQPGSVAPAADPSTVVLMDDAHLLEPKALRALLRRPGGCIVAAVPPLALSPLDRWRRMTFMDVPPIQPGDAAGLVTAMLHQAGEPQTPFTPGATAALERHAQGDPGRMQALVRLSVFLARLESGETVQPHHVEQAAAIDGRVDDDEDDDPGPYAYSDATIAVPSPPAAHGQAAGRSKAKPAGIISWQMASLAVACTCGLLLLPISRLPRHEVPTAISPAISTTHVTPTEPQPALPPPPAPLPPAPVPPPLPPLPADTPLHVSLLVAPGNPAAQARGARIAQLLRDHGVAIDDYQVTPLRPSHAELSYFYAEDAAAAADIAGVLRGELADAHGASPASGSTPRPGTIEIRVPADNLPRRPRG